MNILLISDHIKTGGKLHKRLTVAAGLAPEQIVVVRYDEAATALQDAAFDVVMPHIVGGERQAMLAVEDVNRLVLDQPLVMVGNHGDDRLALYFVREGVQDVFFFDELDTTPLIRRLRMAMERYALTKRAQYYAYHDPLTGLPNRALFRDRLTQQLEIARRQNGRVALHAIDLDLFKEVNDRYGHACGDGLLRVVGERLNNTVRSVDTVARIGGDEFLVIQTNVDTDEAIALTANRLLAALAAPMRVEAFTLQIHGTIGIAVYPDHGRDLDMLCKHADAALYAGKKAGRGVYRLFTPAMTRDSAGRDVRVSIDPTDIPEFANS